MTTAITLTYRCPVCHKHVPASECYMGNWEHIHTACADTKYPVYSIDMDGHEGPTGNGLQDALRFLLENADDGDDIDEITVKREMWTPRELDELPEWGGW